jgi:hypothetical protein
MRCDSPLDPLAFATVRSIFGRSSLVRLMALTVTLTVVLPARAQSPRERCRAATLQAPRADAIAICDRAVVARPGAEDLWAAAHVRLDRAERPTMDDLIRADLLAAAAARLEPSQPWGALARFELARRWGDPALTAQRLDELERAAPGRDTTLQAAASVRPHRPIAPLCGWALVAVVAALTLADALRRRAAAPSRVRVPTALVVLVAAATLAGTPRSARAGFVVDDADPERNVPTQLDANKSPLEFAYYLQELTERAQQAAARGDQPAAIRYLRALARAVPDSSVPQQKLCAALDAHGDHEAALAACRAALGFDGVRAQDFVRFGDLVLARPSPSAAELADVEAAARHLESQPAARVPGLQLECRLAVKSGNLALLDECSRALATAAPNDPSTWVFSWTLASRRGRSDEARGFIERARAAGLAADAVARMESASGGGRLRPLLLGGVGLVVVAGGAWLLRRRRRAAAPPSSGLG